MRGAFSCPPVIFLDAADRLADWKGGGADPALDDAFEKWRTENAEELERLHEKWNRELGGVGFHKDSDPIRDYIGPAWKSHPDLYQEFQQWCTEKGVTVILHTKAMVYEPNPRLGQPGQIKMAVDASIGAVLHEWQHAKDDEASGWHGMLMVYDPVEGPKWEDSAYNVEIDFARQLGYNDAVERLEAMKAERRRELIDYGIDESET